MSDPPEEREWISDAKFSPDGKLVAAVVVKGPRRRLYFWDVAAGKEVRRRIAVGWASRLAFSPDGSKLAVGGEGAQVWDLRRGKQVHDFRYDQQTVGKVRGGWHSRPVATDSPPRLKRHVLT